MLEKRATILIFVTDILSISQEVTISFP